ncbi:MULTISPECIES: hypothetical protein [unclassified Micromonospora]|uniref:hypothetical protein n=1 Tax=unclassified Micromonospora TaxID=2617518 RepID=UPI00249CE22D|nr:MULTISPECIES: hypothetical protein [unclassified Micromonospora]WFE49798.1 hypothetical protein O7617_05445 [Micromonospora sp. WMMD1155]WFF03404.1 hypothetical protein O7616_11895 [Micromonospora sp. WMMD964]
MHKVSLAASTVAAIVLAAGAPAAAAAPTRITIDRHASELYLFEPPGAEPGEAYPATSVDATARSCPAGPYLMSASLVQDGLPTLWATSGRGAGEIQCDGGTAELAMGFARRDPVLHPGKATVRFALRDAYTGEQLAESTRTVWIPC